MLSGMREDLVMVGRFLQPEEADVGRGLLESEGISAWVADDVLAHINPGFTGASGGVRLLVSEENAERARTILENAADKFTLPDSFVPPESEEVSTVDPRDNTPRSWISTFLIGGLTALALMGVLSFLFFTVGVAAGVVALVFVLGGLVGFLLGPLLRKK